MPAKDRLNPYAPPKAPSEGHESAQVIHETSVRSSDAWTTVAAYGSTDRAVEALRLLEKAKIECRVLEDGTAGSSVALHWVRSMPTGGHLLQVRERDLDDAAAVLGVEVDRDDALVVQQNPADDRMKQALVAAIIGAFVCPGIAQLASIVLIVTTPGPLMTAVGRKRRLQALVVDLIVFGVIAISFVTEPSGHGSSFRTMPGR
jgi:hypothetical protein